MAGEGGGGGLIKGLKNIIGHGYNHSPCYVLIAIPIYTTLLFMSYDEPSLEKTGYAFDN